MNSRTAQQQAGCEQEDSCLRLQGRNLRNNIVIRVGACSRHSACYFCLCREKARLWVHPCLCGKMQLIFETIFGQNQGPDTSVSPYTSGLVGSTTTRASQTSSLKSSRLVSFLCLPGDDTQAVPNHVTPRHPSTPCPQNSPQRGSPMGQKALESSLPGSNL